MTIIIDGTVGANKAVVLDSAGKLPAIDGSLVTTLNATQVTTGSIATARLDTGTTDGKVLVLDGSGNMPAISASNMTGVESATKSASSPTLTTNPSGGVGTKWINTTTGNIYICTDATTDGNVWKNSGATSGNIKPLPEFYGTRGLSGGGDVGVVANYAAAAKIEYVTIQTTGNALQFGNFFGPGRDAIDATSNGTRGLWLGGYQGSAVVNNDIDYVTCATTANAQDFGNLTVPRQGPGGASNVTRAVTAGGYCNSCSPTTQNTIDYVTVATTGNSIDFGNATTARWGNHGVASETRIVFSTGGAANSAIMMDYVTIATLGNATNFGNFVSMSDGGFCGDGSRGVHMGGANIEYITIATPGTATSFGTLTTYGSNPYGGGVCGDGSRGIHTGGTINAPQASHVNMDYITIATAGNSTNFGNAYYSRYSHQSCSGG